MPPMVFRWTEFRGEPGEVHQSRSRTRSRPTPDRRSTPAAGELYRRFQPILRSWARGTTADPHHHFSAVVGLEPALGQAGAAHHRLPPVRDEVGGDGDVGPSGG